MASKMFEHRILSDLLPAYCNDPGRRYDIEGFAHNFHQVDDIDAHNFLMGLDAGLVKPVGRLYRAPQSRAGEVFFWEHDKSITPRRITLWVEPVITIATLCRLHFELGWPRECLGSQSVDGAFDVMTYIGSDLEQEYIACEVKKTVKEMDGLIRTMRKFAALPPDDTVKGAERNAYRKVVALRKRRAPLFWAVGPGGNSAAFKLTYLDDSLIAFEEASLQDLEYPGLPTAELKRSD